MIAAFGPKMAEIAGRVGDGINARATHPRLPDLVTTAAHERAAILTRFLVTVFADFDERWLSPDVPDVGSSTRSAPIASSSPSAPLDRRRIAAAGPLLAG